MSENIITNLSDKELAVVQAVDTLGSATIIQIAKEASLKRTTVYNFIDRLVDCNLLSLRIVDGVRHYNSLQQSITMLNAVPSGYKDKYYSIQLCSSAKAIQNEFQSFIKGPHFSLYIGANESYQLLGDKFISQYLKKASQAPTNAHIMYHSSISHLHHDNFENSGIIKRAYDNLPTKNLFIVSCNRVLFSLAEHQETAYVVQDQQLVNFFNFGFYRIWDF